MAQTATITHTRSIEEIAEEFAELSSTSALRFHQARLAYEFIGSTEGKEAAELRESFRKGANDALLRHKEAPLSDPGVTNLVNTWKYMKRANISTVLSDDSAENDRLFAIAKASFNLAGQTFRKKEEDYVIPAIEAILNGADPIKTFEKQTAALVTAKKADAKAKAAAQKEKDGLITFDSIAATLKMLTPENVKGFTAEQKSILRDLVASATAAIK